MDFKECRQALCVTITHHGMLRIMRRSPGLNMTHVHPEEERPKEKLQANASSAAGDMD